jgi:type II restriction enzyme
MYYKSKSQLARVTSESWMASNGYCLACESERILPTAANTQARDFECQDCGHPYELKSALRPFGTKIVDGAYVSMIRRIESGSVSSFLLLRYSQSATVTDLVAIHHSLITREVIQERKPLSPTAKRAGWIGCNILLAGIPPEGRIPLIENGVAIPRENSRAIFAATEKLGKRHLSNRNWSRALLNCLHRLPTSKFTLEQAYGFEHELSMLYPENKNVRPKIRQQLQVLRDAGLLVFEGRGIYRLVYGAKATGDALL